jgi:hypothetical protein
MQHQIKKGGWTTKSNSPKVPFPNPAYFSDIAGLLDFLPPAPIGAGGSCLLRSFTGVDLVSPPQPTAQRRAKAANRFTEITPSPPFEKNVIRS